MKHRDWLRSSANNSSISAVTAPRRHLWFPNCISKPNDRGMLGFRDLDPASGPACALSCSSHVFSWFSSAPPPTTKNILISVLDCGSRASKLRCGCSLGYLEWGGQVTLYGRTWPMKYRHANGVNKDSPRFAVQSCFFFFLRNKGNYNDHISFMSMNSCLGNFLNTGEKIISTLSCHFCLKMSGILMVDDMFVS